MQRVKIKFKHGIMARMQNMESVGIRSDDSE